MSGASAQASEPIVRRPTRLGAVGLAAFNFLYWPYLMGSCAVLFWPALALFVATAPFDKRLRLLGKFTAEWGAHYLERPPYASVTVRGRENVDPNRTVIYVSNHQSMVDTLAVFSVRAPALWVSKVENFYVPFLGWNMSLNRYIALKRGSLPSIMRMYRKCLARLADGHSLMVFPEGTRSLDGNLRHFFRGAFALSTRAKVAIVPIVLDGTGDVLRKGSMSINPTDVDVTVLPAIDPAVVGYDSRRLRDHVQAVMAEELERIRARRAAKA